jgi:hypothetical protein
MADDQSVERFVLLMEHNSQNGRWRESGLGGIAPSNAQTSVATGGAGVSSRRQASVPRRTDVRRRGLAPQGEEGGGNHG